MKLEKVLGPIEFWKWLQWDYHKIETKFGKEYHRGLIAIRNQYNKYCDLMQTPLALEMFVPCKDGEPMEKPRFALPEENDTDIRQNQKAFGEKEKYQQAQEKVLFEGCKIDSMGFLVTSYGGVIGIMGKTKGFKFLLKNGVSIWKTIEDLARQIDLTPTDNFYKKIGL